MPAFVADCFSATRSVPLLFRTWPFARRASGALVILTPPPPVVSVWVDRVGLPRPIMRRTIWGFLTRFLARYPSPPPPPLLGVGNEAFSLGCLTLFPPLTDRFSASFLSLCYEPHAVLYDTLTDNTEVCEGGFAEPHLGVYVFVGGICASSDILKYDIAL